MSHARPGPILNLSDDGLRERVLFAGRSGALGRWKQGTPAIRWQLLAQSSRNPG